VEDTAVKRLLPILLGALIAPTLLNAQQTTYTQANLTADQAGVANHTDAQLSNPWGIAFIPGDVFWIANNNGGTSTTYDATGVKQTITTGIPVAANNPCNPGCPTGIIANTTATDFAGATFVFDTEDGVIASWNGTATATIAVDNSGAGAVYKGLALVHNSQGDFLLAANFRSGQIEVYDHNFHAATLSGGTFTDPNLPAGYAPHGVHVVGTDVFVAYAAQDAPKHDPMIGAGLGIVDQFSDEGLFAKRIVTGGALNAPWGIVRAPATFGKFSNNLLIGNFGDGMINAYDDSGASQGQVVDSKSAPIVNPGLWDLVFGTGGTGDPSTLYFTAGGATQTHGLFGTLVPTPAAGPDFALQLSATSATVMRGGSTSINIASTASGGFSSSVSLSCTGLPTGVTCAFSPTSITPGGAGAQLTIAVGSSYVPRPYLMFGSFLGLGLLGMVVSRRGKKGQVLGAASVVVLLALLLAAVGCGSSSSGRTTPPGTTIMVVGTSGGVSHSDPLTLTIQ
jgi:uncharacterized protein (TIGR03118 family)